MEPIFHIALAEHWEAAKAAGQYTESTRGRTLAEEGFIHCSYTGQVSGVADYAFADVTTPLVLLTIDPARVAPEIKVEGGFPHIYGPLQLDAVIGVRDFHVS